MKVEKVCASASLCDKHTAIDIPPHSKWPSLITNKLESIFMSPQTRPAGKTRSRASSTGFSRISASPHFILTS
ncbi:hypothetical protein LguiB_018101 [Lonicera macranthoides]